MIAYMSEYAKWLRDRYFAWEQNSDGIKGITKFAEWLGISQPLISSYLRGRYKPNLENALKISEKLGNEGLEILDYVRPHYYVEEFSAVPGILRERVFDAFREIDKTLSEKTIVLSPEEAERLADNIMVKYGFTRTDKTKPGNDS